MTTRETSEVKQAAVWLATTPDSMKPHPIIPHLRRRFALTALEASQAIVEARLIRARAN